MSILFSVLATILTAALIGWVAWSYRAWVRLNIVEPITAIAEKVDIAVEGVQNLERVFKHQIGENGSSPSIRTEVFELNRRMAVVEQVHSTDGWTPTEVSDLIAAHPKEEAS